MRRGNDCTEAEFLSPQFGQYKSFAQTSAGYQLERRLFLSILASFITGPCQIVLVASFLGSSSQAHCRENVSPAPSAANESKLLADA